MKILLCCSHRAAELSFKGGLSLNKDKKHYWVFVAGEIQQFKQINYS